ncbi:MAG: hypothetical protein COV34_03555 [Candidatus Zambryskibacteria bacterium CG10_big_fil_rev_8_21_14_0_10_42_12]|uniref:Uncharacterized protein n=1 Tax=Candidatus Zambryskibacteria bacterium CG10_big_fil_rev_8_21_14_0_10_42_12 TaxID=1975115 RepID=A0A2H0QSL7_9BACT|nr:MAG: hypothetical protein COV34_03555 [Candidatus Zambryskibacteria bacterium CG10_big_fil_rev_8_21_14_0_10_42_12]
MVVPTERYPRSREALLNQRPRVDKADNLLDDRGLRAMLSQAKQGGTKGVKGKLNVARTAYRATKIFSSENSRITNGTAMLMIGTAFLLDILEMATSWAVVGIIISVFISIFGTLTFFTWFNIKHVSVGPQNMKRFFIYIITTVLELIPGIDLIPVLAWMWTIGVTLMIIITRLEDKTGIKIPTSPKKAVTGTIEST